MTLRLPTMSILVLACMANVASATALLAGQVRNAAPDADALPTVVDIRVAVTPDTSVGRIGQRQTREDAARETGIKPMAKINNRIANRVQSRLRNRIDRNYDPQANATSPFARTGEQTKFRDNN